MGPGKTGLLALLSFAGLAMADLGVHPSNTAFEQALLELLGAFMLAIVIIAYFAIKFIKNRGASQKKKPESIPKAPEAKPKEGKK